MPKKRIISWILLLSLAACADIKPDAQSSAACVARGYDAGTKEYADCIRSLRQQRLMEQNRKEFEQRRLDDQYERSRR